MIRVWYGMPVSSAIALNQDTVSRSSRMVTGSVRYPASDERISASLHIREFIVVFHALRLE